MVLIRRNTLIASFQDQGHALTALERLREAGFEDRQIGLLAREWVGGETPRAVTQQQAADEGAVAGAAAGAGIGAILGALGVSLIPGAGPVLAGGLLAAAFGGAAMGAAAGTFIGPFIALGLTEEEARYHAGHVEEGRTAVIVRTDDRQEEAREIFLRSGAFDDSMSAAP